MHFGPVCSQYELFDRYCLYRHPGDLAAVTGTAGGWCHLVVQAEDARVGSVFFFLISFFPFLSFFFSSQTPFLICSSHLYYLASLSLLPFDNHLFPVSQVSMARQISFSVLAVTL